MMTQADSQKAGRRCAGLAMTELLITLLLSLMLIAGVLSVFTGGLRSADTVLVSERLVLGGNAAIARLQTDLRQAGFAGCNSSLPSAQHASRWRVLAEASDRPWLRTVVQPIWGSKAQSLDMLSLVDSASLASGLEPNSDVLVVGFASGPGQRISAHIGVGGTESTELVTAAASNLELGTVALASDCDTAAVFTVDELVGAPARTVRIRRGAGNRHGDLGKDFTGGELHPWQQHAWYLVSETDGSYSLYRNLERIAEGVAQFLVEFGVDTSGDRQVDRYYPAAEINDWSSIAAVRVHLLMAAETTDSNNSPPQSLEFAGRRYVASDTRHYQSFTTTVGLRNRLP